LNLLTESKTINSKKTILFATLDWGLGHAVRDIPLVKELLASNFKVILAGSGESLTLLNREFPELEIIRFHSKEIAYSSKKKMFLFKLILQIPSFLIYTLKERLIIDKIVKKKSVDLIISDNRYGCRNKKIKSVFITHQVFPKLSKGLKFLESLMARIHKRLIEKFDLCLIPDFRGSVNFSGELSHKKELGPRYKFIGILSDFKPINEPVKPEYDILFIASGPEPQRTLFIKKVYSQLKDIKLKALIVSGEPHHEFEYQIDNITIINHLTRKNLREKIILSEAIITQAGYTSIMDLSVLRKKAILIPTPGQPEQEYLANRLKDNRIFIIEDRQSFQISDALVKLQLFEAQFPDIYSINCDKFSDVIHEISSQKSNLLN
jgi:predicted glycosyltransferase